MHVYKYSKEHSDLTQWLDFVEEGVEVLQGQPIQSGRIDWGNAEGPMAVGVWQCTPGKVRLINPFSEFCTVVKGSVTLTDGKGVSTLCGIGDSFFIAQGEESTWDVHEDFQKSFFLRIDCDISLQK